VKYDPDIHHRQSIRLKNYDYSQAGAYFVTICTQNKECLFGEIEVGKMSLNEYGQITTKCWHDLPNHYPHIELDEFVVMPNHTHGIIVIKPAPTVKQHGLPEIIRAFKTFSSKQINLIRSTTGIPVWQRNYYEHIICSEPELNKVREYIVSNPLNWETDENYKN